MILDTRNAEAISRVVADKGWTGLESFRFNDVTLSGLVELGRLMTLHRKAFADPLRQMFINVTEATQLLEQILSYFQDGIAPVVGRDNIYSAPEKELWIVKSSACLESNDFSLYLQRFERSLRQAGFINPFPKQLTSALLEIAENIVRHSAETGKRPLGVIGFHITQGSMNYVAADIGRGVLASLRENPDFSQLQEDSDALVAAARDGATRIQAHGSGDGYRQVFKAFLDREGVLLMRSGSGKAKISGNIAQRTAEKGYDDFVKGLRVTGLCSLKGKSEEIRFRA